MGVLQRFERRLGGLVEGAFARVFGGVVQPVEVAAALQREAADKRQIIARGRVLVPNDFVVELGASDAQRLGEYDAPLRRELAAMVEEHAAEQGWSFVGPVGVRLEHVSELATGVFRVRSAVLHPELSPPAAQPTPPARPARPARPVGDTAPAPRPRPYIRILPSGGEVSDRVVTLSRDVTRLGRGPAADVRLTDTGVSRLHAEIRLLGPDATVVDLESTNGTTVNGLRVHTSPLAHGDQIGLGSTVLVFHRAG